MSTTTATSAPGQSPLPDSFDALNSLEATATFLGKSERTIQRLVESGQLVCTRVGRTPKFTPDAIADYLASRVGAPSTHGPRAKTSKTAKPSRHPKYR